MAKAFVNLYWDKELEKLDAGALHSSIQEAVYYQFNTSELVFLKCVELDIPVEGFK